MLRCAALWPKYTQTGYSQSSVWEIWGEERQGKRTKYNISVYMCVAVVLSCCRVVVLLCQRENRGKKILHHSAVHQKRSWSREVAAAAAVLSNVLCSGALVK